MASGEGIFKRNCVWRVSVVFTGGTDDLSLLQSDHVCELYAVFVYGISGSGPIFCAEEWNAKIYAFAVQCDFDDFDQLLWAFSLSGSPGNAGRKGDAARFAAGRISICNPFFSGRVVLWFSFGSNGIGVGGERE